MEHIEMKKAQILSYDTLNNLFTLFISGRGFIVIFYTMNAHQHISTTSNSQVPIIFIIVDIFLFFIICHFIISEYTISLFLTWNETEFSILFTNFLFCFDKM